MTLGLAGEAMTLTPRGALYWEAERTLFAADLHLGKTASFRAHGVALPEGVSASTLDRLSTDLREMGAERLIVLGDLWHDRHGLAPLTADLFRAWRAAHPMPVELVPGNHDRRLEQWVESMGLAVLAAGARRGPFSLWHSPPEQADGYALAGHVHPVVRFAGTRLKVLWIGERGAVLPAYGLFTGGFAISPRPQDRLLAVTGTAVHDLAPR